MQSVGGCYIFTPHTVECRDITQRVRFNRRLVRRAVTCAVCLLSARSNSTVCLEKGLVDVMTIFFGLEDEELECQTVIRIGLP